MITIPRSVRIFIGSTPIDMRKSIDGLMSIVKDELEKDPCSGHLFVFVGKQKDKVKILYWDGNGFVLYLKRLEQGRFQLLDEEPLAADLGQRPVEDLVAARRHAEQLDGAAWI